MWLSLIPQIHSPGDSPDLSMRHHHFIEENPQFYDGKRILPIKITFHVFDVSEVFFLRFFVGVCFCGRLDAVRTSFANHKMFLRILEFLMENLHLLEDVKIA